MSLITLPTPLAPPAPAPVLTTAQKQERAAVMARELMLQAYLQNLGFYNRGMDLFWNNADGLDPQEVFDALNLDPVTGAPTGDAAKSVQFAGALAGLINLGMPGTIPAPTASLAINPDGTVKVGV